MRTLTDCDECDYQGNIARLVKGGSPKDIAAARDMLEQGWMDGDILEDDAITMRKMITSEQLPLELAKTIKRINFCLLQAAGTTDRFKRSGYITAAERLARRLPGKSPKRFHSIIQGSGRNIVQSRQPLITNIGDAADMHLALLCGEAPLSPGELSPHLRILFYGALSGLEKKDRRVQTGLILNTLGEASALPDDLTLQDGVEFLSEQNAKSALKTPPILTACQHRLIATSHAMLSQSLTNRAGKVWEQTHGTKLVA
jgi:hypothetical protein